jgi:hypothetical protein
MSREIIIPMKANLLPFRRDVLCSVWVCDPAETRPEVFHFLLKLFVDTHNPIEEQLAPQSNAAQHSACPPETCGVLHLSTCSSSSPPIGNVFIQMPGEIIECIDFIEQKIADGSSRCRWKTVIDPRTMKSSDRKR